MIAPEVTARIRAILLHPEPRITIDVAAQLLGVSRAHIDKAIREGDVEAIGTCAGRRIDLRELAAHTLHEWPVHAIEEALGADASLILPPALRTRKLALRLPRCLIEMLNVLAAESHQTVDMYLEMMIEEIAGNEKERLAPLVPGIEEAYWWPLEVPAPHVS